MISDDCDCDSDILPPDNPKIKHVKCKIIKLMDDQLRRAKPYIDKVSKKDVCVGKRRCKKAASTFFSKICLYSISMLGVLALALIIGAYLGAAICGSSRVPGSGYGVF